MPGRHCGHRTHYENCRRATHRREGPRETWRIASKRRSLRTKVFSHDSLLQRQSLLSVANAINHRHAFGLVNNHGAANDDEPDGTAAAVCRHPSTNAWGVTRLNPSQPWLHRAIYLLYKILLDIGESLWKQKKRRLPRPSQTRLKEHAKKRAGAKASLRRRSDFPKATYLTMKGTKFLPGWIPLSKLRGLSSLRP